MRMSKFNEDWNTEKEGITMVNKVLMDFLCRETEWEELGNEKLLHQLPEFGQEVGAAINEGRLIEFTGELSSLLEKMDLYKASLLSTFIGFACEKEEDTSAGEGIVKLFSRSCKQVYEMFQSLGEDGECGLPEDMSEIYRINGDWARAYFGFNILCVSVMAFLTRDVSLRKIMEEPEIAEQVEYLTEETPESPYLKSVYYVDLMRNTCGKRKLLVLYPAKKSGFLAEANDMNNCFHLLFLLEEQIHQKLGEKYGMHEFRAAKSLIRLAYGEYPDDCWNNSYSMQFMECNYGAAGHNTYEQDDAMRLIWGEMPPEAIPEIDGRGVIILFETGINRSFSANFLAVPHPALKPSVEIERELTEAEYDAWVRKIEENLPQAE